MEEFAELRTVVHGSKSNPNNGKEIIEDVIADAMLQQVLLCPREYSVIATLNLNGDYLSDALAAQVGGIGIAPGANFRRHRVVRSNARHSTEVHRALMRNRLLILSAK